MRSKDHQYIFQHSQFREAPHQISRSFVLPFVRCQSMNSVYLACRAHKHTAHAGRSLRGVYFNRDPLVVLPGRRSWETSSVHGAEKGRKNEEHAGEQSNSGQCSRRQIPTARSANSGLSLDLSRGALLTLNGPILRRPGDTRARGGRRLKLIAVYHTYIAVKIVATPSDDGQGIPSRSAFCYKSTDVILDGSALFYGLSSTYYYANTSRGNRMK